MGGRAAKARTLRASALAAQAAQLGYGDISLDMAAGFETFVSWHLHTATPELC